MSASGQPAPDLVGLWGAEKSFGPEARGELTVSRKGESWLARLGSFEVPARSDDGLLTFSLPGERGEFRGRLAKNERSILGHWIQPRTVVSRVRYATPVSLESAAGKTFRGTVAPLEDRLSLYLVLQRKEDGTLSGFFRSPERNFGRSFPIARVLVEGSAVRLFGAREGQAALVGELREQGATLSIFVPILGATFDFTRRGRDQALGFYPRTPAGDYAYRKPDALDDGWATAAPGEVGLDPEPLAKLVQSILQTPTDSVSTPYVQGLLLARHGKVVLDEYFYGFDPERPHDTRSASKSLATTMAGIAIDRGAFDVSTPVYSALGRRYGPFAHPDPRNAQLNVEHLLTMSSGFDCDDNDEKSPGNEDRMYAQTNQPDWYKYTLDLPMAREPGAKAVYCSAGINLLGAMIGKSTGAWLPDFFRDTIAAPLSIRHYYVNLTPTGEGYLGGGFHLRPRDFLKLGQLFLAGGKWRGRQVVSRKWAERATVPHSSINGPADYGYGWWMTEYRVAGKIHRAYYASGNGGQLVIVLPGLDLVVLFTGGNYNNYPVWAKFRDELVPRFILAAVR